MTRLGVFIGSNPLPLETLEPVGEQSTPWGAAADVPLRLAVDGGHELYFLHRHGRDHQFAPHQINYRANVWLMHSLGLDGMVGTYTVGGIDPALAVGQLVVPEQIIDYSWGREGTYDDELRHIEFGDPYDASLRQHLLDADSTLHDGGVYACTQGPRLETAAEIQRLARDGCTLVGMTGMPEAALCRELELPLVPVCLVVNPAAGVGDGPIEMDEILRVGAQGASRITDLLLRFVQR